MLAVACGPVAERASSPPLPETRDGPRVRPSQTSAQPTGDAGVGPTYTRAGPDTTLLDAGKPPLALLRYELVPGSAHRFLVEHRLALFDEQREIGSLEVHAPLAIESEARDAFALRLELGPARTVREGRSDSLGWGGGERSADEADARLLAQVTLKPSGAIESAHVDAGSSAALVSLYETLLNLDVPPSQAVGAGARWHSERSQPGGGWTKTEYEIVEMHANRATFRVQRRQVDGDASNDVRAVGEWTFTGDAWPPTGHDQLTAVPESGPAVRFSVRFAVTRTP